MFALFERLLRPTEISQGPAPPARLVAFYWHFAQQAKGLFIALFAAGLVVALLDTLIPVFMGRVVSLVTASDAANAVRANPGRCSPAWRWCC